MKVNTGDRIGKELEGDSCDFFLIPQYNSLSCSAYLKKLRVAQLVKKFHEPFTEQNNRNVKHYIPTLSSQLTPARFWTLLAPCRPQRCTVSQQVGQNTWPQTQGCKMLGSTYGLWISTKLTWYCYVKCNLFPPTYGHFSSHSVTAFTNFSTCSNKHFMLFHMTQLNYVRIPMRCLSRQMVYS